MVWMGCLPYFSVRARSKAQAGLAGLGGPDEVVCRRKLRACV